MWNPCSYHTYHRFIRRKKDCFSTWNLNPTGISAGFSNPAGATASLLFFMLPISPNGLVFYLQVYFLIVFKLIIFIFPSCKFATPESSSFSQLGLLNLSLRIWQSSASRRGTNFQVIVIDRYPRKSVNSLFQFQSGGFLFLQEWQHTQLFFIFPLDFN